MTRINTESPKYKIKLDLIDKKILEILSQNSRTPISIISKKIRLKREIVNYRINKLIKQRIILKFFPHINFKKLKLSIFHVFIVLDEKTKEKKEKFLTTINHHPNILRVREYSDRWDYEFVFAAKNIKIFDKILTNLFAKFSDIIIEKNELVVLKNYSFLLLPYHFYEHKIEKYKQSEKSKQDLKYKPDSKDLEILSILGDNSRLSTYEISKKINLSPDTIGLRIKKMLKSKIISKFTILPNLTSLGYSWYTFAIELSMFSQVWESKLKTFVKYHPHIIKVHKTFGSWDLLLNIVVKEQSEFHKLIKDIKNEFSPIIKHHATFVLYKEHKHTSFPKKLLSM